MDDVMVVSHKQQDAIDWSKCLFKLKGDKAEVSGIYLGASLSDAETIDGSKCWSVSSVKYVQKAIDNVEKMLWKSGRKLPTKFVTPTTCKY